MTIEKDKSLSASKKGLLILFLTAAAITAAWFITKKKTAGSPFHQ